MPLRDTGYAAGQAEVYASQATGQVADQLERVPVPEAAERLGITENALRKRVQRNTVDWMRDSDGRVFVYLPPANPEQPSDQAEDQAASQATGQVADQATQLGVGQAELAESLQDQVDYLRSIVEKRDRELSEMRRLLAGALERIPAIEAPPDTPTPDTSPGPREAFQTASDGTSGSDEGREGDAGQEKPSWWRRWILGTE